MPKAKNKRIICRISDQLDLDLQKLASSLHQPEAEIIRQALEEFINRAHVKNGESWYQKAKRFRVMGKRGHSIKDNDLPSDLSTNKKYFEGFGE